jgi:hypothetical protein
MQGWQTGSLGLLAQARLHYLTVCCGRALLL